MEPIKWRTVARLFLIAGVRLGEVLGLKWENAGFEGSRIRICNSVFYRADRGIYEDTPKASASDQYVSLPEETMRLLRQYEAWQKEERLRLGDYFDFQGLAAAQDNGKPMHPDRVTSWLARFSRCHDLPHVNPHAFRHPNVKPKTKTFSSF